MVIGQIIIKDKPSSIWNTTIIKLIVGVIVIPLSIVFVILVFIYITIHDFIAHKILRRQEEPIKYKEKILFQNPVLKLIEDDFAFGSEANKLAEDFMWSLVDHDDEMHIFKVVANIDTLEIHNAFLTGFRLETENELILQRITAKNDKPHSDLISIDKKSGQLTKLTDVGLYLLYKYDEQLCEIIGFDRKNEIGIKVSGVKLISNN